MQMLAILQARFSSSRLPGKVLKPVLGVPMLRRQLERVGRAKSIEKLVVATSLDNSDNEVAQICQENGFECFRGSLSDVLDRFYQAARPLAPQHVVRLTGDCPLADPELIDQLITFHLQGDFDYSTNTIEPSFPDGLDVEIVRFSCLETAWREAKLPSQREHVLPFISQQPARFKIGSFKQATDYSYLRWTVDEPLDFELIHQIYEALYPANPAFTTADILALVDKYPELQTLNTHYERNEGYLKSLREDELFKSSNQDKSEG